MAKVGKARIGQYSLEFLSVFIAVVSAFALNNWSESRRLAASESKILREISNGLKKDLEDLALNKIGHEQGLAACRYWRAAACADDVDVGQFRQHFMGLTRDFISLQNRSGYESLKSKGLETVQDDDLRYDIIALYEYDFSIIRTMEESYAEQQFHSSYFQEINALISPSFVFDAAGKLSDLELPLRLDATAKKSLLSYLWKIQLNRASMIPLYEKTKQRAEQIIAKIKVYLST